MFVSDEDLSEDKKKIAKCRLQAIPSTIRISIGGKGSFNKDELKEHLEKEDEIGKEFIEMQIAGLRAFKEI